MAKMTVELSCPTTVFPNHLLRLRRLMLVMHRLCLLVFLLGFGSLFLHHTLGLAHRPAGAACSTGSCRQQQEYKEIINKFFHRSEIIEIQK